MLAERNRCDPAAVLDGDPRTLTRLMEAGGLPGAGAARESGLIATFVARQRLVEEPLALAEIRRALRDARLL